MTKHRCAGRLEGHDGDARCEGVLERVQGAPEPAASPVELSGRNPGQAAAQALLGELNFVACLLQDADGSLADLGAEQVGKGVDP